MIFHFAEFLKCDVVFKQRCGESQNDETPQSNLHFFYFPYMCCRPVSNAAEVMQIISSVQKLRAHCPTLVHTDSSRSHLVVTLTVSSKSPNAVALGEHSPEFIGHLPTVPHCNPLALPFSPQAAECKDGHAALHPEGVVESTLSPCQPHHPQLI